MMFLRHFLPLMTTIMTMKHFMLPMMRMFFKPRHLLPRMMLILMIKHLLLLIVRYWR